MPVSSPNDHPNPTQGRQREFGKSRKFKHFQLALNSPNNGNFGAGNRRSRGPSWRTFPEEKATGPPQTALGWSRRAAPPAYHWCPRARTRRARADRRPAYTRFFQPLVTDCPVRPQVPHRHHMQRANQYVMQELRSIANVCGAFNKQGRRPVPERALSWPFGGGTSPGPARACMPTTPQSCTCVGVGVTCV